jgi:cytochrome c5
MRNTIFGGLLALGLFSCAGSGGRDIGDLPQGEDPAEGGISEVPNPSPAMASLSGTPLGRLQRGHEVYMLKCGECHTYMLPQNLDIEDWEDAMPKMIRHAGLETSDEKAVLDYVVAVKKQRGQ